MMNAGTIASLIFAAFFGTMGVLLGIFKGEAAVFISGYNTMPEDKQKLYDKDKMVRDMRNSCYIWTAVMIAGAIGSAFFWNKSFYVAVVVWIILFLKDVHWSEKKAFDKYRIK